MKNWDEQLDLLIRARTPLIWIRSNEEERLEALLEEAAERLKPRRLASWDYIEGLKGVINSKGLGARQPMAVLQWLQNLDTNSPTILLVKDFHRFCEDAGIARMLINLSAQLREKPHTIVLCSGSWSLTNDLDEALTVLDLPLPKENELRNLLNNIAKATGRILEKDVLEELSHACSGLSEIRVRQVAARALAQRGEMGREDLFEILEEKRQSIAKSEVLE